jgi:hypothetical protein
MIKNLKFHQLVEKEIKELCYGTITVNAIVRSGVVDLKSSNLVSQRRIKFRVDKKRKGV